MNLEKMPGLSLLLKKINEYSIDRLVRLQVQGGDFRVNDANFPTLHQALIEAAKILDVSPVPELYLHEGTGHISSYAVGVEQPSIGVNLEAMEWLSHDELLFLFGHELARVKSGYIAYQQLSNFMPMLKSVLSNTTLGLGGLAANGVEVALYNWIVMSKFTSDRAGLLACQNIDSAISTLMKLSGLPNEYLNKQTIDAFEAQARQFDTNTLSNLDRVTKIVSFMNYQSPWGVMRAAELLEWADSGEYSRLLEFSI
ncbi:MAG: M48 family metallopeptidase [Chamaesiphon sp. CSU_1_12]|nr:M48 family metallopeptidase [Chamaesiphon sp. CSU_1_12]